MGKVGFQDFWVAGSRFYFKRDDIDGSEQPWLDLGRVTPVNPALAVEKVELRDPDGGINALVDEGLTAVNETYEVTTSNMNLDNLNLMWLGNTLASFSQTAADKSDVAHTAAFAGHMLKLHDSDTDKTNLFGMTSISGLVMADASDSATVSTANITAINPTTKVLTVDTDLTTSPLLAANDHIIVMQGDATDARNARTYKVTAVTTSTITVDEAPFTSESGVTMPMYFNDAGGETGTILSQQVRDGETGDWAVVSNDRGIVEIMSASANFVAGRNVHAYYTLDSISGNRLFKPQAAKGVIQGTGIFVWSRQNNADQTIRECTVSVTPSGGGISDEDFSNMTFTITVLNDLQSNDPAGRMVQPIGTLPTRS